MTRNQGTPAQKLEFLTPYLPASRKTQSLFTNDARDGEGYVVDGDGAVGVAN